MSTFIVSRKQLLLCCLLLILTHIILISLLVHVSFLDDTIENPIPITLAKAKDMITMNSFNISNNNESILNIHNWSMVYFQHVRKSAGTAMVDLFRSNGLCDINGSCIAIKAKYGVTLSFKQMKDLNIKNGIKIMINEYYPFYLHSYLGFRNIHWNDMLLITILRDPMQRIFSDLLYDGVWSCKGSDYAFTHDFFLRRCAKDFEVKYTSNIYTKVFSGSWGYSMPWYNLNKSNIEYNIYHQVDHIHFNIAWTIIQQFHIIIILESYKDTYIQLKCYGIDNDIQHLRHKNLGNRKKKNNKTLQEFPHLYKWLISNNQYDMKLYELAKERALQKARVCKDYLRENQSL